MPPGRRLAALRREELCEMADDFSQAALPSGECAVESEEAAEWPYWRKRYVEGEVKLLCYLRAASDRGHSRQCFAVFERPDRSEDMLWDSHLLKGADPERDRVGDLSGNEQYPVFVDSVEFVEAPQRIELRRTVSVVRLKALDEVLGLRTEAADLLRSLLFEEVGVHEYRELGSLGRVHVGLMDERELPGELVERRPVVEKNVPDADAPSDERWLFEDFGPQDAFACLRVFLADDAVRVFIEEPLNVRLEAFRVFVCAGRYSDDAPYAGGYGGCTRSQARGVA